MRRASVIAPVLAGALALVVPNDASALGALTPIGCVVAVGSPSTLCPETAAGLGGGPTRVAVSPDGATVYATSIQSDSVVALRRSVAGALTPIGCVTDDESLPVGCTQTADGLDGATDVAVSADGRSVYVVSFGDDAVVRFNRASDGTLSPAGCVDDNDTGTDACGQTMDALGNPAGLATSPDGLTVYVAAGGDDAVTLLNRAADGTLTPAGCVDDNDSGPETCGATSDGLDSVNSVVVSPDGASVYTAADNEGAVARFNRAPGGGLTPAGCVEDNEALDGPDACAVSMDGLRQAKAVTVSADNRTVYAATFDNAVAIMNRAPGGAITPAGCVASATTGETCALILPGLIGAQWVATSGDGRTVYVAAAGSESVVALRRDPATGALSAGTCIASPAIPTACPQRTSGLDLVRAVALSPDDVSVYSVGDGPSTSALLHLGGELPPRCGGSSSTGSAGAAQVVALDCSDANGDALTIEIVRGPAHGALGAVDQAAGTVTYTPGGSFTGLDSFTLRARTGDVTSDVVTQSVWVQPAVAGPAGAAGPAGPAGPPGPGSLPAGSAGLPGAATRVTAARLAALLGNDVFTARAGRRHAFRLACTAACAATLVIRRGRRTLVTLRRRLDAAGRSAIAWNGRRAGRTLGAGTYALTLTAVGTDGQRATDTARLRLTRR
jgi:DNA-binding beta-propeller fold protein YncE